MLQTESTFKNMKSEQTKKCDSKLYFRHYCLFPETSLTSEGLESIVRAYALISVMTWPPQASNLCDGVAPTGPDLCDGMVPSGP